MDKEVWRHCFGTLRLSRADITQIIAEHLGARFGIDASAVKVELWPTKGQYGTDSLADVDMTEHWHARRVKT